MRNRWFWWASSAAAGMPGATSATRASPAPRAARPARRNPRSPSLTRSRPGQRCEPIPRRVRVVAEVELLEVEHPVLLGDPAAALAVQVLEGLPRLVFGVAPGTVVQDQLLLADEAVAVTVRHGIEGIDQGAHPRHEGISLADEGIEA